MSGSPTSGRTAWALWYWFHVYFAIILTARRVLHMMQALENGAFAHPQKARRMDLLSAHPDSLCRLCDRGVFLAGQDRHLLGFKAFFEDIRARAEAV